MGKKRKGFCGWIQGIFKSSSKVPQAVNATSIKANKTEAATNASESSETNQQTAVSSSDKVNGAIDSKSMTVQDDPDLMEALQKFKNSYKEFLAKCGESESFVSMTPRKIEEAVDNAGKNQNIGVSAQMFESYISDIMKTMKAKKELRDTQWQGKLENFLTNSYPLVKTSLELAGAIGEVNLTSIFILTA
jgi:hypothetical protein